jgi:hypothetical protein
MKIIKAQHWYPAVESGELTHSRPAARALEAGHLDFARKLALLIPLLLMSGVGSYSAEPAPRSLRTVLDFRPTNEKTPVGAGQRLIGNQHDLSHVLEDLAAAERKRQALLAGCFSKLQEVEPDYWEAPTAQNRVRMHAALRDLIRTDIKTRHEIAHVAREAARSTRQILLEIESQPAGQNMISGLLAEQRDRSHTRIIDIDARLQAAGIDVGRPEGPNPLPLEILKILDRETLSEDSGGWLSGFYGKWLAEAGEDLPEVSELTRFLEAKATALDLLAWQNEQGIEEARLAETQIVNGTQIAAYRNLIKRINRQQIAGNLQEEAEERAPTTTAEQSVEVDLLHAPEDGHTGIDAQAAAQSEQNGMLLPQPLQLPASSDEE